MSLYETPFHAELAEAIRKQIDEDAAPLIAGMASSFDDYRKRCGQIRGLVRALEIADDVSTKLYGNRQETR